jgi:antitoxin component of RelBE/YafQ-DinJ toxin-antitoxin module
MNNTVLQIPINKSLKDQATQAALNLGFSSLQEYVRVFLTKVAQGQTTISINEIDEETLSPKASKRYDKMIKDIESGKEPVYTATSVQDLFDQLNGKKPPQPLIQSKIPKKLPQTD